LIQKIYSEVSMKRIQLFFLGFIALILGLFPSAHAQVFDDPAATQSHFTLTTPPGSPNEFPGGPTTLNIGEIDQSILSSVTSQALPDVAVLGISSNQIAQPVPVGPAGALGSNLAPLWVIRHSSAADTRALELVPRTDLMLNAINNAPYYEFPSTVQILDLNGDGQNDLAYFGGFIVGGMAKLSNVATDLFAVEGIPSSPFFQDTVSILGNISQDANIPQPTGTQGSQPSLASGDFNNANGTDLAVYDFDDSTPTDQIQVLENNGSIGILPNIFTDITGPVVPPNNAGFAVSSVDFDGDGNLDLAMTYAVVGVGPAAADFLTVYLGNGDGTFDADPVVTVALTIQDDFLHGLVTGNFDGDGPPDFAISSNLSFFNPSEIYLVFCNSVTPPPNCQLEYLILDSFVLNLAAADFNGDGLDDLALTRINCTDFGNCADRNGDVAVHLNAGGGTFLPEPDQVLTLLETDDTHLAQVVTGDIDGCGGPDLAYTGTITVAQAVPGSVEGAGGSNFLASVAFNSNEDPVANAGTAVPVNGGFQIGGTPANPTCSDPTGDPLAIQWVQTAGNPATINDPTAANPIITNVDGEVTFTVTCSDACGAQASASVTFIGGQFVFGSGCSLYKGL
jgi:hypothetical protein